jgi:hypothetical protein
MRRRPHEAICTGLGRRAVFGPQSTTVQVGGSGWVTAITAAGPQPVSEAVNDLLDVAAVIYRSERQLPRRGPSNPNVRYELVMPLIDPDVWTGKPQSLLEDILGFLGMAEWRVQFVRRPRRRRQYYTSVPQKRPVSRVALWSGGLDSTSGIGAELVPTSGTRLCSFYTRQASLQSKLAEELKYPTPTQWRLAGAEGRGRSFFYRSFLFLALGAATAETFGAREIVQFENGILASSIPPVPSLAMTKHAHPRLHRLLEQLLESITGREWRIENPLSQMTKREATEAMRRKQGSKKAAELAAQTQSCWNLSAPHAFGVRKFRGQTKRPNEHCGVCVPCIIRRTALPQEDFVFDLNEPSVRGHAKLGAHFLEYAEFVLAIRAASGQAGLRRVLPAEGLELIDDGFTDLKSLEILLRKFADEFVETFTLRT